MSARRSRELTHGWVRLARAGILGGASLTLATAAHLLGGGALPGAGLLAVAGVALALAAVSLTGRRLRFWMLLAVLSVEQLLLHVLFHASTAMTGCTAAAVPGSTMPGSTMPGSTMPGHDMVSASVCVDGSPATAGWSMLLAHALAIAATAWLLTRGERWLWRVVDRIHCHAAARPTRSRRTPQGIIVGSAVVRPRGRYLTSGSRAPPVV